MLQKPRSYQSFKVCQAPTNTQSLPYHFSIVGGGEFNGTKWYGSINRKEFYLVSIVGIKSIGGEEEEQEQKHKEKQNGGGHHEEMEWQQQEEGMGNKYEEGKDNEEGHKEKKIKQLEPQKYVKQS